mmetsp:Transcript_97907/g.193810  ORF Transcript_97907/g.193810 Transcript_97907/m.193810 type:complete len:669 (+) Transcript_97907:16-2022(+)
MQFHEAPYHRFPLVTLWLAHARLLWLVGGTRAAAAPPSLRPQAKQLAPAPSAPSGFIPRRMLPEWQPRVSGAVGLGSLRGHDDHASGNDAATKGRGEIIRMAALKIQRFGKKCDGPELHQVVTNVSVPNDAATDLGPRAGNLPHTVIQQQQQQQQQKLKQKQQSQLPEPVFTQLGAQEAAEGRARPSATPTPENKSSPPLLGNRHRMARVAATTTPKAMHNEPTALQGRAIERGVTVEDVQDVIVEDAEAHPLVEAGTATESRGAPPDLAEAPSPMPFAATAPEGDAPNPGNALVLMSACAGVILVLSCVVLFTGLLAVTAPLDTPAVTQLISENENPGGVRALVAKVPRCEGAEVEQRLPVAGGYDCAIPKPISSHELLRLEATIDGPLTGFMALTAPLTQRSCVLYSTVVSRERHDGMHPVPVAFASSSVDFSVSLVKAPHIRIIISGEDVSLFDVCGGRCAERHVLSQAPDHWQDFVLARRVGADSPARGSADGWRVGGCQAAVPLEFQECALLVGASVTLLGELHRGADGLLTLRPWQGHTAGPKEPTSAVTTELTRTSWEPNSAVATESWRTSWELNGCEAPATTWQAQSANTTNMLSGKVLVSDDPELLIVAEEGASAVVASGASAALAPPPRSGCWRRCRTVSANYLRNAAQLPPPQDVAG